MDIEELEAALNRMALPWERILNKDDLYLALADAFAVLDRVPTQTQIDAFWEISELGALMAEHGIKSLDEERAWGYEHRYAIAGMPGLWGRWAVLAIREEEEW